MVTMRLTKNHTFSGQLLWYHGYKIARTNTSLICIYPKEGHTHESTKENNMGGSQAKKGLLVRVTSKNNIIFWRLSYPTPSKTLWNCHSWFRIHWTLLLINATCHRKTKSINTLRLRLSNGDTIDSMHRALLNIPDLSEAASVAHVSPYMANNSLL